MSSSLPSRPDSIRLAHRAQYAIWSHSAQVSIPITMHVLWTLSQSLVSTPWGPLSTSSVSTSRHVVPSTQPIWSPSRRGMLYPSSQVEESLSTVTSRLGKRLSTGHSSAILSQPAPDQTAHGPPQYHTTLTYHHDKKTPTHLLIAGLTTSAYHHARGTLSTQVLLSITLPSCPGEPVPDAGLPSRRRAICISM